MILTYDEFGGQYDHVSPPGTTGAVPGRPPVRPGNTDSGTRDQPSLKSKFVVDHVEHDTTAILTTIEKRWNLGRDENRNRRTWSLPRQYAAHGL